MVLSNDLTFFCLFFFVSGKSGVSGSVRVTLSGAEKLQPGRRSAPKGRRHRAVCSVYIAGAAALFA